MLNQAGKRFPSRCLPRLLLLDPQRRTSVLLLPFLSRKLKLCHLYCNGSFTQAPEIGFHGGASFPVAAGHHKYQCSPTMQVVQWPFVNLCALHSMKSHAGSWTQQIDHWTGCYADLMHVFAHADHRIRLQEDHSLSRLKRMNQLVVHSSIRQVGKLRTSRIRLTRRLRRTRSQSLHKAGG